MTTNDDGLLPAGYKMRDVLTDNGLSEHGPSQDVTNSTVGTLPHLL